MKDSSGVPKKRALNHMPQRYQGSRKYEEIRKVRINVLTSLLRSDGERIDARFLFN